MKRIAGFAIGAANSLVVLVVSAGWAADVHPAVLLADPPAARLQTRMAQETFACLIETADPQALRAMNIDVGAVINNVAVARLPRGAITRVAAAPAVRTIWPSWPVEPHLNISTADTRSGGVYLGINSDLPANSGNTGRDVIVGIVDSGIDWRHRDFIINEDEFGFEPQSRILALWDQTLAPIGGETSPAGFTYGVEYTQHTINRALRFIPTATVRSLDTDGHGTHVAGIAAGDGSHSDGDPPTGTYRGVAPEADLVVVKTSYTTAAVLDACAYIFNVATVHGKPCVINLSLGHHFGSHDGRQPGGLGELLSAMTGPGRLIVASVGNERESQLHTEVTLSPAGTASLVYHQATATETTWIEIWHHKDDAYSVSVTLPGGQSTTTVAAGNSSQQTLAGQIISIFNAVNAAMTQADGDKSIQLCATVDTVQYLSTGSWTLSLTRTAAGGSGAVDAYIPLTTFNAHWTSPAPTVEEIISSPANGDNILAVAAHNTRFSWKTHGGSIIPCCTLETLGAVASFSNPGPLRRESASNPNLLQTPDLSAPGQAIGSALSSDSSVGSALKLDDGYHRILSGTSMSAPHLTGALALALRVNPALTVQQLRHIMHTRAGMGDTFALRRDALTTALPNDDYGHGKLNAQGLLDALAPTAVVHWYAYE